MKKILFFTLILFITNFSHAQSLLPIKYGLKVGANIANTSSSANEGVQNIENTSAIGVAGGFYMEIALNNKWYINPELVYTQKGTSFADEFTHDYQTNQRDKYNSTNELKISYLELNPTISYKASYKIALNIGPSLSFLLNSDYTSIYNKPLHEELESSAFDEETLDVGLNLGISYYLTDKLLIDLKINTGFMKIGEVSQTTFVGDSNTTEDDKIRKFELKNNTTCLSIGYLF